MALVCSCPEAAAITTIPAVTCIESFGEVQKVIIQRTRDGSTLNEIVIATDDPTLLATWTALKAAVDSTKVQITPYIAELTNDDADPREASSVGIGGIARTLGSDFTSSTGQFHDIPQNVIKTIRQYNCEVGVSVFLVNAAGQIGGIADDNDAATTFRGIPVRSFFVGNKVLGGRNDVDKNRIQWKYEPDWSDEFYIVTPVFDPLTEL